MEAGLYMVGTPIGNLGDITRRALEVLEGADVILAEDTRHTRKLLSAYDIHTPTKSYHKFNEAARCELVAQLISHEGRAVALVTDSGMPGLSDPGDRLAAYCAKHDIPVTVVPGPSALTSAVALSGLCPGPFHFEGFLPHKSGARRRRLEALAPHEAPLVLFESPYRMPRLLGELRDTMGQRPVFIARELTKKFEELMHGRADELAGRLENKNWKGECVVVVGREDR